MTPEEQSCYDALRTERDELIGMREEVLHYQREFHRLRDERDEAEALLREAAPHVGRGPVTKELRRRLDAFLAPDSASHRENERG